jgi:Glycosyltransferase family 87
LLGALIAAFALASLALLLLLQRQAAGADFSCFWAGAKVALRTPARLYDFSYVTGLQGWPLGPDKLRPYIYPPSALFLFIPFALVPFRVGYGLWVTLSAALLLWAGLKARLPWWLLLLPPVGLVIYCGQVTLLIAAMVLGGLAWQRTRPLAAGVLFGLAAAVKPQIVMLIPIALLAEGRWRSLIAAGVTVAGLAAAAALIWGVGSWFEWLSALQRFQHVIFNDKSLVDDAITPYATLQSLGLPGALAFLLIAPVVVGVWMTFRRTQDLADRSIAVLGGALLISPYAMNYEAALLAPAVAAYLARTEDRRWLAYVVASVVYVAASPLGVMPVVAVLALPALKLWQTAQSAETPH